MGRKYLCSQMESKWLGDSFLLVGDVDQVEKGAERGELRYKQASIRESETPSQHVSKISTIQILPQDCNSQARLNYLDTVM